MTVRDKVLALCFAAALAGCGTMHPPQEFSLGEPRKFDAIDIQIGRAEPTAGPAAEAPVELDGELITMLMADMMSARIAGSSAQPPVRHPIEYGLGIAPEYDRAGSEDRPRKRLRGTCVIVPGILGRDSASHLVDALGFAGWAVVLVWPPLVERAEQVMESTGGQTPGERGAAVGEVVERTIRESAFVAQLQLIGVQSRFPELRGKPVLLIGESMGAIAGVGVAATGDVPYDAALFVAGGGGFLEVAAQTSLRALLFGGMPLEDRDFARGFHSRCALDPLRAAESLRGGPVIVVNATSDLIVPTAAQEALWDALGRPPRFLWEGGHLDLFRSGRSSIVEIARRMSETVGERSRAVEVLYRIRPRDEDARPRGD